MFLPQNMTEQEKTLAATVARQILAKEQPSAPKEIAASRSWAEQVAAEMIWAERAPDAYENNPDAQPRPEDPELIEIDLQAAWEDEYRTKESLRIYQAAIDSGEITDEDQHQLANDVMFGRVEIEIPPRPY